MLPDAVTISKPLDSLNVSVVPAISSVPIPGPYYGDISATFAVLPAKETSIENTDKLRLKNGGVDAVAILYDVSPALSAQELFNKLSQYPKVIVCDHHSGAAPKAEAPGRELTGAEVVVNTLNDLWSKGLLSRSNQEPLSLVGITNSLNIDPDSLICRLLIESFCNPKLRDQIWSPSGIQMLTDAARFGDTTFFGGIDIPSLDYNTLPRSTQFAFAILQMINEEKRNFVSDALFDLAVLRYNTQRYFHLSHANEGKQQFYRHVLSVEGSLTDHLQEKLGEHYTSKESLVETFKRYILLQNPTATPDEAAREYQNFQNQFVFENTSRRDIREVFLGRKSPDNVFSQKHEPFFNANAVHSLFERLSQSLPDLFLNPEKYRDKVTQFIDDLKYVHHFAKERNTIVGGNTPICITTLNERLDRELNTPQRLQRLPINDWLREASAAFGDPWLHIMDRRGEFVVSSRFALPGENRPHINLADPEIVNALNNLERSSCPEGIEPTRILTKANLWLPLGKVHFSKDALINFLIAHYNTIVRDEPKTLRETPEMHTVLTIEGREVPFDGSYYYRHAHSNA